MDIHSTLNLLIPMIAAALGAIAKDYLPKLLNAKYYKLALQVLPIVDAVLADNTKAYGESGVRTILQETIKSVADDKLTPEEISKVLSLVLALFNPAKAASATVTEDNEKLIKAISSAEHITDLDLSRISFSLKP